MRMGGLWRAAFAPVFNHIQQVMDVNATIVIDVCEFDSQCVMKRIQVIGIDIAVVVHVALFGAVGDVVLTAVLDEHARDVVFAGAADGAVFEDDPAQIALFSTQTLGDGPRDVGGQVHPIGIATDGAVDEVWVAEIN